MNRAPLLLAAALALLVVFTVWLVASRIDDHPDTWVRPVVGEEPVVSTVAPHDPQDALRTTTTTIPPRVRQKAFQAAYASEIVTLIREGFARFGEHVAEQAVRVAACETGDTFDPGATNGVHRGLFQISTRYHAERTARLGYTLDQLWEARPNIAVAADLYAEQGWRPWQCRP